MCHCLFQNNTTARVRHLGQATDKVLPLASGGSLRPGQHSHFWSVSAERHLAFVRVSRGRVWGVTRYAGFGGHCQPLPPEAGRDSEVFGRKNRPLGGNAATSRAVWSRPWFWDRGSAWCGRIIYISDSNVGVKMVTKRFSVLISALNGYHAVTKSTHTLILKSNWSCDVIPHNDQPIIAVYIISVEVSVCHYSSGLWKMYSSK